jgi:hypothetical protein
MNERRLVPSHHARGVVPLAIHNNIFEEYGFVVKGKAVGVNGMI